MCTIDEFSSVLIQGWKVSSPKDASWIVCDVLQASNISELLGIYEPHGQTRRPRECPGKSWLESPRTAGTLGELWALWLTSLWSLQVHFVWRRRGCLVGGKHELSDGRQQAADLGQWGAHPSPGTLCPALWGKQCWEPDLNRGLAVSAFIRVDDYENTEADECHALIF